MKDKAPKAADLTGFQQYHNWIQLHQEAQETPTTTTSHKINGRTKSSNGHNTKTISLGSLRMANFH